MDPLFEVHMLNDEGKTRARRIATCFNVLLDELKAICSGSDMGREFAIVKTKLEEAAFFAKKAMANDPSNQEEK